MRGDSWARTVAALTAAGLFAVLSSGCGRLTIRTWVKVVEAESSGSVNIDFGGPRVLPLGRVQGGFLGVVSLDTTNLLKPLPGTITLREIRIAADEPGVLGNVCVWGDPAVPSAGTVVVNILGGGPSSANLVLGLRATTGLSETFGLDPVSLQQPASFDLGSGLNITTLLSAADSGSADGLFATSAAFVGATDIAGIPVEFDLDLQVTNEATPPLFDGDLATFCGPYFAEQGTKLFYGLNPKSSYLLSDRLDDPKPPLVIPLADIGAAPGSTLRLAKVGAYSDSGSLLADGTDTRLSGVFSATNVVRGPNEQKRVTGAIDAGANVVTGSVTRCFLLLCFPQSTDVAEDFRIDPTVDVVVPAGARFLVVAPLSKDLSWGGNSNFGFGVDVTVDPGP